MELRIGIALLALAGCTGDVDTNNSGLYGGDAALCGLPPSLDFGDAQLGATYTEYVVLENCGGTELHAEIAASGAGFSVSEDDALVDLDPDGTFSLAVVFAPQQRGDYQGRLEIASEDPDSPAVIPLYGEVR
jgi:hypothetical protein